MDARLAKLFTPTPVRVVPAPASLAAQVTDNSPRSAPSNQLQQVFARLAQPQKMAQSA